MYQIIKSSKLIRWLFVLLIILIITTSQYPNAVYAATLFSDDFSDGNDDGWTVNSGTWAVESGEYSQSDTSASGYRTTIANKKYSDIEVEYTYNIKDYAGNTGNWAGVIVRKTNTSDNYNDSGYMVYMRYNGKVHLYKAGTGNIASYDTGEAQTGARSLKVTLSGSEINVYYNGGTTPVISKTDLAFKNGYVSLVTGKTHTHFDNVVITSDYQSVELAAANKNVNVNGTTEFRVLGHTGTTEKDISELAYELNYDNTKVSIDTDKRMIKGLVQGSHNITLTKNELTHTITIHVNDYNSAIMVRGEDTIIEDFEGTVPSEYLPDANFSIISDGNNKVLSIDAIGAMRNTGLITGAYDESDYIIEADVKQIDGSASTNGGFSIGVRTLSDDKNYRFRYVDILKYNETTHMYDSNSTAIRDRIGIARDEGGSLSSWYYGAMKTDGTLGILDTSTRSFNQYYQMTGVVAGTTAKKPDGTIMYNNLIHRISELNGTLIGEVSATTAETDYETGGLKMTPLTEGKAFLGAENTKVYMDNVRISKLHVARGIELFITDSWINTGQTSYFEVRALPSGEIIPSDKLAFTYDSNAVTLDTSNNTITSTTEGNHLITVTAQDVLSGTEKIYTTVLTVRDADITENFENDRIENPRYLSVPSTDIVTDGTNKVYKLTNKISRLFGYEDWTNYSVEGKIKIVNRTLDTTDTNTAFEIVMRRKSLQGEYRGQGGHPFVYRVGSTSSDNYMRIGTSAGSKTDIEGSVWTDFKAEVSQDQMIFTLGANKQYYALPSFINGGFSFRAVNSDIYLDDIVVRNVIGDPYGVSMSTSISSDNSNVTVNKYDVIKMPEITSVKASYSGGEIKYITTDNNLAWSIVSGSEKAELMLGDTIRFRSGAVDGDTVTVRASYEGNTADIILTVDVPPDTETDYIKNRTWIRQENAMMKLARNYELGTQLETAKLSFLQWIFGKMMLYPEEKNYDAEVNWMIDMAEAEELKGPAISGAEFVVNQMLVLYKKLDGRVDVSANVWDRMIQYIQGFHYEEPDAGISENHKIQHYAGAIITSETWPSATMWNGKTGSTNLETYKNYMKDWVNRRLMVGMGEYDSKSYYGINLAALSLLDTFSGDTAVKSMASDMLTYLYADMAVDSIESKLGGGHGRSYANTIYFYNGQTHYANDILFDTSLRKVNENYVNMNIQGAPLMVSSYRPSDIVLSIVRDQIKRFNNKERKTIYQIPDDTSITESLKKYTHVSPEYILGSVVQEDEVSGLDAGYKTVDGTWVPQGHQDIPWSLTFGKFNDVVIFDSHPGPKGETDTKSKHAYFNGSYGCFCSKMFQEENVLLGMHNITGSDQLQFTHFWLIKEQFDQVDEESGWIFLKHGTVFAAIKPLKNGTISTSAQYKWTESGKYAGREIKIDSSDTAFIVEVVDSLEYSGTFSDFKTAIKANSIAYSTGSPYYIEYTGLNGKTLRMEYDTDIRKIDGNEVDFSAYKLHESPYMTAEWDVGTITIQYGASSETISLYP